jgi:glutathione synthase/RimK-type ligase-like ATP-grasp enzyme
VKWLIATTYNWKAISGHGKYSKPNNPYARVYAWIIRALLAKWWEVKQVRTAEQRVNSMRHEQAISGEASVLHDKLVYLEPDLVFHDPNNFDLQNRTTAGNHFTDISARTFQRLIAQVNRDSHEAIFMATKWRVERVYSLNSSRWQDEISHKDVFAKVAPTIGVPTPITKVLPDLSKLQSPIKTWKLRRELTGSSRGEIIVKAVNSSGGRGIFPLKTNGDAVSILQDNWSKDTNYVAQPLLPLPADLPYSIRTVTWGGKVLGAALLMNPTSKVVSNSHHGGAVPFELGLPGDNPRTGGMSKLDQIWHSERRKFFDTATYCGIDLERRALPEEVYLLSEMISRHPSNTLLRGNDFMFDERWKPLAIESNSHPGPPWTGMWNVIDDDTASGERLEINIATRLIVQAILDQSKK